MGVRNTCQAHGPPAVLDCLVWPSAQQVMHMGNQTPGSKKWAGGCATTQIPTLREGQVGGTNKATIPPCRVSWLAESSESTPTEPRAPPRHATSASTLPAPTTAHQVRQPTSFTVQFDPNNKEAKKTQTRCCCKQLTTMQAKQRTTATAKPHRIPTSSHRDPGRYISHHLGCFI